MTISVKTSGGGYDITLKRGALSTAHTLMKLDRRVLVVTDDGVPDEYARTVADQCGTAHIITLRQGERTKCADSYLYLLKKLTELGFTRTDCVVAVGGGVVGDLSGFTASTYMRGIDFYNIPTTVLSQVDSSIGGKTGIDFCGYKNIVGAFYQPKAVIIDPDTLKTLPDRQVSNGLAEAVKMSLTSDPALFEMFENRTALTDIDTIIERSLMIKKSVVEADEKEAGLRKILNFGHTLAHAVESDNELNGLYHGECVAIGMVPMCDESVRKRLVPVLDWLNLPHTFADTDRLFDAMRHDKKMSGDKITVVRVPSVGAYELVTLDGDGLMKLVREGK